MCSKTNNCFKNNWVKTDGENIFFLVHNMFLVTFKNEIKNMREKE